MSNYIFKLNDYEFSPANVGQITLSVSLEKEAGSYQYVTVLDGELIFKNEAYDYILQNGDCQQINLEILNKCGRQQISLFKGFFAKSEGEINRTKNEFKVTPRQDTLYRCLTDALDVEFNMLQTPQIITADYAGLPVIEFLFPRGGLNYPTEYPFFGEYIDAISGLGANVFAREVQFTPCQGGEPQPPIGTGWELLEDRCEQGLSKWVRRADTLDTFTGNVAFVAFVPPAAPTPPPVTAANENWVLGDTVETATAGLAFYIDYNGVIDAYGGIQTLKNGRNLTDVINYGLNQVCPELDLQSLFLTSDENPVTGNIPSSTKDIQIHSISDIKNPTADLPATIETTTLRTLLEQWCANSLNCFWYVDENTKRLIIEHYVSLNAQGTTVVTQKSEDIISYDNTNNPLQESFESTETDIDFKGVPISYFNNACTSEPKNYNRASIYTDVQTIINNPDEFGNDGLVFILPESLAPKVSTEPSGAKAEDGAITGLFKANAPLGMANLHAKFWKTNRPFESGELNFEQTAFDKEPNLLGATINYSTCCIGKFLPYSNFETFQSANSRLEEATINLLNSNIELKTRF